MNSLQNSNLCVNEIISGSLDIASPPEVFLKVSEILDDPTKNAFDAGRIIENDPGLTSRLLKIVNSAIFGFPSTITSVPRAITIIGAHELRNLVLATVVVDRFSTSPSAIPSMREFWSSSVRCALFSKILGTHHPQCNDMSTLFVCGLLHNLGCLIMYARIPELARTAVLNAESENITIDQAERQAIGFDHYEVGAALSKLWHLPDLIEATQRNHVHPENADSFVQESTIVALAHQLSIQAELAETHEAVATDLIQRLRDCLGFKSDMLETVSETVDAQFQEIFQLIYHA